MQTIDTVRLKEALSRSLNLMASYPGAEELQKELRGQINSLDQYEMEKDKVKGPEKKTEAGRPATLFEALVQSEAAVRNRKKGHICSELSLSSNIVLEQARNYLSSDDLKNLQTVLVDIYLQVAY